MTHRRRLGRLAALAGFGLVLGGGSVAAGTAPAPIPDGDRPTLVGSFLQLCADGPANPARILALAARQGSRSDMPRALGSTGGLRCAAIGVQLARNAL